MSRPKSHPLVVRGNEIIALFLSGQPIWAYLIKADAAVPNGWR